MTVLTLQEAAALLKTTPRTLSTLPIRRSKLGREWRYLEEDLLAYLRGEAVPKSEPEPDQMVDGLQSIRPQTQAVDAPRLTRHHHGIYAMDGGKR